MTAINGAGKSNSSNEVSSRTNILGKILHDYMANANACLFKEM